VIEEKLAKNVFKVSEHPHLRIKPGFEKDVRLRMMVMFCPAGLYREAEDGKVTVSTDGCLECGTCRVICGTEILDWQYPEGGLGVQYRFG